ncbi:Iron-sulfur cluster repair protein YtfE [Lentibacillus sp. JNUCC-1]|uniref:iron-sulfur cluster repair di-iron protein n=1 Tax=Lentibacillus sp. JNUCC-1 TaxID=2654513 RepID=UPI0012E7F814|nr:iron-sulfur cluster repair di-iron protein [Lentibacillus sp. JNUCC-1]MUV36293.1 Iron-sulfur cluster repair protein YtfE [Lentibacillus sp. JNUCC-1]
MTTFTAEHKPADIVKVFPKASDLFKAHRIDFCCGGDQPLKNVFTENHLDEADILSKLNNLYKDWSAEGHAVTDWESVPLNELVDHIIHTHHAYLNDELPALNQFVSKIFRAHGAKHPHLVELNRLFNAFKLEMEEHMVKEEADVFPLIKEYELNPSEALRTQIHQANDELEAEHDEAGNLIKQMRHITHDFQPPEDACNSYRITYARLAELEDQTFTHVHLENNILFKRI